MVPAIRRAAVTFVRNHCFRGTCSFGSSAMNSGQCWAIISGFVHASDAQLIRQPLALPSSNVLLRALGATRSDSPPDFQSCFSRSGNPWILLLGRGAYRTRWAWPYRADFLFGLQQK